MELVRRLIVLISLLLLQATHVPALELKLQALRKQAPNDYLKELQHLFSDILRSVQVERCLVVITDNLHHNMYDQSLIQNARRLHPQFYVRINDSEDLLAPHYQTVRMLKAIRKFNCDLHLVTLLNGLQVKRFLRFGNKHRLLNTHHKFIFLYDKRLFESDMLHVWSSMVSSVFVRWMPENRFSLYTVPYPNILNGFVTTLYITDWQRGRRVNRVQLFPDKNSNLKGIHLPVAVMEHVPMVSMSSNKLTFEGLEVEIVRALGETLNFEPVFYTTSDKETERWGRELPNGSFTGLIGQMTNRTARMAIGDLHLNKLYSSVMDLSTPHSLECLTFLTPESSQDNSWKTLIQPFSSGMWVGVLLSLFAVGTLFYTISWIHALALRRHPFAACQFFALFRRNATSNLLDRRLFRDVKFRAALNHMLVRSKHEDLFDNFANCVLLTYSMLMYVSLPRMPRNWPLRVLTGWYWMYCILVTVTYRASFTAILANPAARITIDTLEELAKSRIIGTVWGNENRKFFAEAFDEVAQEIGVKLELVNDIYGVTDRIAKGTHAYYDNEFHLRYLRLLGSKRREDDEVLHVMRDCVVRMPIALGLEKNSPLKPNIDKYLQRLREAGLITKWLKDAIKDLPAEEQVLQEALMDLRKFWSSFVALGIGYFLSVCAFFAEHLHFKYIVQKHPLYDKYNTRLYYNSQRHHAQAVIKSLRLKT